MRVRSDELIAVRSHRLLDELVNMREGAELVGVVEEDEATRGEELVRVEEIAFRLLVRVVAVDEAECDRTAEARVTAEDVRECAPVHQSEKNSSDES